MAISHLILIKASMKINNLFFSNKNQVINLCRMNHQIYAIIYSCVNLSQCKYINLSGFRPQINIQNTNGVQTKFMIIAHESFKASTECVCERERINKFDIKFMDFFAIYIFFIDWFIHVLTHLCLWEIKKLLFLY